MLGAIVLLAVAAENVAVFWSHYFRGFGFPWDFTETYYAVVAWWTSAVRNGTLPHWVPFHVMGYPLALNLQSGLFYPVFWVLPATGVGYSFRVAVALQCLHVGAGALGAYALLRRLGRSRRDALVGAFGFQLFGGFYSNAQHPDIVRGYALVPWLLWSLTPSARPGSRRVRAVFLLPLFVFLLASGGYTGILLASAPMAAAWVSLHVAARGWSERRSSLRFALCAAGLGLLGLGVSAMALGPAWLHRGELARYHDYASFDRSGLELSHLPGLVLPNRWLPGNVSLNCAFLPLPILLAALWAPVRRRSGWPGLGLLVISTLMVAGPSSPLFRLLRMAFPPLGYSRLPAVDYRAFMALGLVILGAAGFARLRAAKIQWRHGMAAGLLAAAAVVVARRSGDCWAAVLLALSFVAVSALFWLRARRPAAALLGTGALLLLVLADSGRVLLSMEHPRLRGQDLWRLPDIEGAHRRGYPEVFDGRPAGVLPAELHALRPGARPARRDSEPGRYRAAGYLTGALFTDEHAGNALQALRRVEGDPSSAAFMRGPWAAILLPAGTSTDALFGATRGAHGSVRQISWGNDRNDYQVSLEEPALLVENELYFPGWTATLSSLDAPVVAERVRDAFRGWRLPAGEYRMTTRFRLPCMRELLCVSALSAAAWAAAWLLATRRGRSPRAAAPGQR